MSFRDYNPERFTPRAVCVLIPSQVSFYAIESNKFPGKLVLPGGKIEEGETPEIAVVRERIKQKVSALQDSGAKVVVVNIDEARWR